MKKIITHGGKAHRDDFLAVGLACFIAGGKALVYRRSPTLAELNDPEVWVIDVGGRHEPDINNFDHHQLPRGTEECALSLMAKAYSHEGMTYHELWQHSPWYRAVVTADALGMGGLAQKLKIERIPAELTAGAIDPFILAEFAQGTATIAVNPKWVNLARDVIAHHVQAATKLVAKFTTLDREIEIVHQEIAGKDRQILVAPLLDPWGLPSYLEQRGLDVVATITANPPDRGGGVCLQRVQDGETLLDFRRVAEEKEIIFCHNGGFMCTCAPGTELQNLVGLIKKAGE